MRYSTRGLSERDAAAYSRWIETVTPHHGAGWTTFQKLFQTHPCAGDGFGPCMWSGSTVGMMELDHVRGSKDGNVPELFQKAGAGLAWDEVPKTVPRCANCHRVKTGRERDTVRGRYNLMFK